MTGRISWRAVGLCALRHPLAAPRLGWLAARYGRDRAKLWLGCRRAGVSLAEIQRLSRQPKT